MRKKRACHFWGIPLLLAAIIPLCSSKCTSICHSVYPSTNCAYFNEDLLPDDGSKPLTPLPECNGDSGTLAECRSAGCWDQQSGVCQCSVLDGPFGKCTEQDAMCTMKVSCYPGLYATGLWDCLDSDYETCGTLPYCVWEESSDQPTISNEPTVSVAPSSSPYVGCTGNATFEPCRTFGTTLYWDSCAYYSDRPGEPVNNQKLCTVAEEECAASGCLEAGCGCLYDEEEHSCRFTYYDGTICDDHLACREPKACADLSYSECDLYASCSWVGPPPSPAPSLVPTFSFRPSELPSSEPSWVPTNLPSNLPSKEPSHSPSVRPSVSQKPSLQPSSQPTVSPRPSNNPTQEDTLSPSLDPTGQPSTGPTISPTSHLKTTTTTTKQPSPMPTTNTATNSNIFERQEDQTDVTSISTLAPTSSANARKSAAGITGITMALVVVAAG